MRAPLFTTMLLVAASSAAAQQAADPQLPAGPDSSHAALSERGSSALRVAKWSTAAAAAGSAAYGFISNRRADERFSRLEQVCVDEPLRCVETLPDGAYADEALEAEYQEVRSIDSRARTALVVAQVGVAASVVLFILDLRNSTAPANIPYEPRPFGITPAHDGGISLSVQLPAF